VSPRREMFVTVGAITVAAGLVLVAAGRPRVAINVAGAQASGATTPAATALALVALAGAGTLLLVRGWARTVIGVLLLGAAAGIVAVFLTRPDITWFALTGSPGAAVSMHRSVWAWLGVTAGVVIGAAALATGWRGRGWPAPRRRFSGPTGTPTSQADRPRDAWEALDRGEDPTT
jgi:tryptophan-associated transmembrane protein